MSTAQPIAKLPGTDELLGDLPAIVEKYSKRDPETTYELLEQCVTAIALSLDDGWLRAEPLLNFRARRGWATAGLTHHGYSVDIAAHWREHFPGLIREHGIDLFAFVRLDATAVMLPSGARLPMQWIAVDVLGAAGEHYMAQLPYKVEGDRPRAAGEWALVDARSVDLSDTFTDPVDVLEALSEAA